jgi:hypothetical protein
MLYVSFVWLEARDIDIATETTIFLRPGMNQCQEMSAVHGIIIPIARVSDTVVPKQDNDATRTVYCRLCHQCNAEVA